MKEDCNWYVQYVTRATPAAVTTAAAAINLDGPRTMDLSAWALQFPAIHRQQAKPASP